MNVTEELADWEDSRMMNRKRQWFTIDEALEQLALHKPVQRRYLQQLKNSRNNMTTSSSPPPPLHTTDETALNLSNQIPQSPSSSLRETQTTESVAVQADADTDVATVASITNCIATTGTPIQQSTSKAAAAI